MSANDVKPQLRIFRSGNQPRAISMFACTHSETHVSVSVCTAENAYPRFHDAILSTKYFDDETGFVYYGYRFYAPEFGRWPNRDPIGELGGAGMYVYVSNDTLNRQDYLGMTSLVSWKGVALYYLDLQNRKVQIVNPSTFDVNTIPFHPNVLDPLAGGETSISFEADEHVEVQKRDGTWQKQCYHVAVILKLARQAQIPLSTENNRLNTGTYGYWNHGGSGYANGTRDFTQTVVNAPNGIARGSVFPREAYEEHERGHARGMLDLWPELDQFIDQRIQGQWFRYTFRLNPYLKNVVTRDFMNRGRVKRYNDPADDGVINFMNGLAQGSLNWSQAFVPPTAQGRWDPNVSTTVGTGAQSVRVKYTWMFQ